MNSVKKYKKYNTTMHKNGSGKRFFHRKSIFRRFLGPRGSPRGLPGRPGRLPEAFQCFCDSLLCLKTALDRVLGGPGEVPGHPQGPPRDHFGRILGRFLKLIFRRTAMATLSFLWTLSSNFLTFSSLLSCGHVTLIRATDELLIDR